jgi:TFIIF-interacting CTD phosphatase-like protein
VNVYNSNGLNEEKELKSRSCMSYKFIHGFLIFLIVLSPEICVGFMSMVSEVYIEISLMTPTSTAFDDRSTSHPDLLLLYIRRTDNNAFCEFG